MKVSKTAKFKTVRIGDLFDDLGIEPRQKNVYPVEFDIKVKTPYGYYPIDVLFTTEKQEQITTYFTNGRRLTTSPKHQVKLIDGSWVAVETLRENDQVESELSTTRVKKQVHKKKQRVLYDMTVRDVNCYYSNGILSHNSWLSVAMAAHALKLGFNVNYYTLELGETYVGKRFDACLTGIKMSEIDNHREKVESVLKNLKGKLVIKEYAPKTVTVNTIKAHVQRTMDLEHKPDLIVIDYVDYLRPAGKGFRTERKDEIDDVFIATKALAKELGVPIITPSQVNRSGAKDDVIEGDKAAGSYDKMMVADICFSLSRKKEDKVLGTGRIHIMKNRYGNDGITYEAEMDTDNGSVKLLGAMSESGPQNHPYAEITKKFFAEASSPF
jgi:hypothetical protein